MAGSSPAMTMQGINRFFRTVEGGNPFIALVCIGYGDKVTSAPDNRLSSEQSSLAAASRAAIAGAYRTPEPVCVPPLVAEARIDPPAAASVAALARRLVAQVRAYRAHAFGVEVLMKEFSLSSPEGVALMCLARFAPAHPGRANARPSHPRQAFPRRLGRACGREPLLVRQCIRVGPFDHRQACRHA